MREPGEDDDLDDEGPMVPLGEALRVYADAVRLGLVERAPPSTLPWVAMAKLREGQRDRIRKAGEQMRAMRDEWRAKGRRDAVDAADHVLSAMRAVYRHADEERARLLACNTVEDFDNYWRNR